MSFNLIDLVKDQLNDQVMGQLGNVIGGSAAQNESALGSAIPGILNSLTNAGGVSKNSADSLFSAINDQDDGILDKLGDLLGGNNQSSMMNAGTKTLGSLLGGGGGSGGGLGSLVGAISGFSGAKKSGTSSLLGLLAPIIFSVVKRKLLGGGKSGFNVGSLMSMLGGQKDNVTAAMPNGFSDQLKSLGLDKITAGVSSNVNETVTQTTQSVQREGKSLISKLLPLALLVGAGLLAYNFFFKGNTDTEQRTETGTTTEPVINTTKNTAPTQISPQDIGKKVSGTMGSMTTSLGSITDVASAKAAIPSLTSANNDLGKLAGMMNKLPAGAKDQVSQLVAQGIPQLQNTINKISAIPGVGPVIRPFVESLATKLALFK